MEYDFNSNKENKNNKIKFKYKLLVTLTIIFLVYGIASVNVNLAEVIREKSSFLISFRNNPPEVIIDLGEKHVIFSTEVFKNFKDGSVVIFNSVRETIVSLKR